MTLPRRTALLVAALLSTGVVQAHEYQAGDIEIAHPHAPAPPPGAPNVAGYLTLENDGDVPDRLLGATVDFAGSVEMHTTTMDGDVARMRELKDGIEIPAGATVALVPNETHLMFVDPRPGIVVGDELAATLHFERGGDVDVTFNVEDGATMQGGEMDHGTDHGMDHGTGAEMDHGTSGETTRGMDGEMSGDVKHGMDHGTKPAN